MASLAATQEAASVYGQEFFENIWCKDKSFQKFWCNVREDAKARHPAYIQRYFTSAELSIGSIYHHLSQ